MFLLVLSVAYWRTRASYYSWYKLHGVVDKKVPCLISGFHREVDGNCALLVYYAASSGNSLPTFRRQPFGLIFRV